MQRFDCTPSDARARLDAAGGFRHGLMPIRRRESDWCRTPGGVVMADTAGESIEGNLGIGFDRRLKPEYPGLDLEPTRDRLPEGGRGR